jgi:hypothetical protein
MNLTAWIWTVDAVLWTPIVTVVVVRLDRERRRSP